MEDILRLLRTDPRWGPAVENLVALNESRGGEAEAAALAYVGAYDGRRGR